ncbi:MAG TPA: nucleoside-triphosphatase [Ardenticatenaceae bacterium]|nr:nucleoside-triphosphatase [Ardenticatenaceae bacterium]
MNEMGSGRPVILLTGAPGAGKSTVIQKVLGRLGARAAGFYTREVRSAGERTGFEIVTTGGEVAWLATKRQEVAFAREVSFHGYRVNLDALDLVAAPALLDATRQGKVVVVDEIGPMEIFSESFCRAVRVLRDGDATVVGTVVERPNAFADAVKAHPRVRVVPVTRENREALAVRICGWVM